MAYVGGFCVGKDELLQFILIIKSDMSVIVARLILTCLMEEQSCKLL